MAVDQYGQYVHDLGPYPRKALMEHCGRKRAQRIFRDTKNGVVHIGWIVAGRWFRVFEVIPLANPA